MLSCARGSQQLYTKVHTKVTVLCTLIIFIARRAPLIFRFDSFHLLMCFWFSRYREYIPSTFLSTYQPSTNSLANNSIQGGAWTELNNRIKKSRGLKTIEPPVFKHNKPNAEQNAKIDVILSVAPGLSAPHGHKSRILPGVSTGNDLL